MKIHKIFNNERARLIYTLRLEGHIYNSLSKQFKICGERIAQILKQIEIRIKNKDVYSPYGNAPCYICNALREGKIKSLKEAKQKTDWELLTLRGLGKKALDYIRNYEPEIWYDG